MDTEYTTESYGYSSTDPFSNLTGLPRGGGYGPEFDFGAFVKLPVVNVMTTLAVIGIIGNSIAMYILVVGKAIRKHMPYVFLFNQSLADLLSCCYVLSVNYYMVRIPYGGKSGAIDYLFCVALRAGYLGVITTLVSTYNLAVIAAERTLSILWPVTHRNYVTEKSQKRAAVTVWVAVSVMLLPFMLSNNGINPAGFCYQWDRIKDRRYAILFIVVYESASFYAPLMVILCGYAGIIYKIFSAQCTIKKRAMNALRTLLIVVVVYFMCSVWRSMLSLAVAFGAKLDRNTSNLFMATYLMRTVSFVVNPLIYSLQYFDYRAELKRRLCRHCCRDGAVGQDMEASEKSSVS